jgi:lysophospholipase L1-like esterase
MPSSPPAASPPRRLPLPVKAALGPLVAVVILGGIELALRLLWGPPEPDPGLVPLSVATLVDEGPQMRLSHAVDARQDVVVPKDAPQARRVVVLGGSSVRHAWTLPAEQSFPTWLDRALPDVDVVNLGSPGQQTGGLARIAGDVAPLSPDLVVVYAGHNDFSRVVFHGEVGAPRLALVPVLQALSHSWIFNRLRQGAMPLATRRVDQRSPVLVTEDDRALQLRAEALEAYGRGLRAIAAASPAPVLFLTQLRNGDAPPTGVLAAPGSPCAEAAGRLRTNNLRNPHGERDAVVAVCGEDSSLGAWLAALAARADGDTAGAARAFRRSLDLDPLPVRAPAAADAVVAEAAAATGSGFLDLSAVLEPMPPGRWFDDTLHPTPRVRG